MTVTALLTDRSRVFSILHAPLNLLIIVFIEQIAVAPESSKPGFASFFDFHLWVLLLATWRKKQQHQRSQAYFPINYFMLHMNL